MRKLYFLFFAFLSLGSGLLRGQSKTIVVPVVVHVVYDSSYSSDWNIDDIVINKQMEILNQDFRRLNPGAANTFPAFQGVAADVGIQFELAKGLPGAPNGVKRTHAPYPKAGIQGYPFEDSDGDGYLSPADESNLFMKIASPSYDPSRYLNIWVGDMRREGIVAVAVSPYQPSFDIQYDGIVMSASVFGLHTLYGAITSIPKVDYAQYGHTLTHEVGHWLGLRHIWGDHGGCEVNTQDGNPNNDLPFQVDDMIADTPVQATFTSHITTPTFPVYSCNPGSTDPSQSDMFQNFMDYTKDADVNLFTEGQAALMRSQFAEEERRASFMICGTPPVSNHINDGNYSFNIVENDTGCGAFSFKLAGDLPHNFNVTWNASPANIFVNPTGVGMNAQIETIPGIPLTNASIYFTLTPADGACGTTINTAAHSFTTISAAPVPPSTLYSVSHNINGPSSCFYPGDFVDIHESPGPLTHLDAESIVWSVAASNGGNVNQIGAFTGETNNTRLFQTVSISPWASPGCYTISATLKNECGQSITRSVTLTVVPPGTSAASVIPCQTVSGSGNPSNCNLGSGGSGGPGGGGNVPFSVHVSPNPAKNTFGIDIATLQGEGESVETESKLNVNAVYQVRIYDENGSQVYADKAASGKFNIATNGLKNGLYIVHISQGRHVIKKKVLIDN